MQDGTMARRLSLVGSGKVVFLKLIQIKASQAEVPAFGCGTVTGSHDNQDHLAKSVLLAQGGMAKIFSLAGDEELLFRLNDLVHDRHNCGGPRFYTTGLKPVAL
jgi:hypothetical protein